MNIKILKYSCSSITYEIISNDIYNLQEEIEVTLKTEDGVTVTTQKTKKVVNTIYHLKSNCSYNLSINIKGEIISSKKITTSKNKYTLDVRDFGARGNAKDNATPFIQAAILACPKHGKVLIPEGKYLINSLFLKSHMELEICEKATLIADTNPNNFPLLPDIAEDYDDDTFISIGNWEGNPCKSYASIINAINVEDVKIYGKGTVDGCASFENWWGDPKHKKNGIARPRLFFSNNSRKILIEGLTFKNSPSWTIHPFLSEDIDIININIINPALSPNTDGIDPDSCNNVSIVGVYFSLGDDCIAIKSGKIFMAEHNSLPSKSITIRQCHMKSGHGAVTLGSELACGIYKVLVENCIFTETDRGLRIKTRRGRGEKARIDDITFNKIKMDGVKIPFVVNSYYFCDIDGHSSYVQTRDKLEIDKRTPSIGKLVFSNIEARKCEIAIASIEGLSEKPIEKIVFNNIKIDFNKNAKKAVPAMSDGIKEMKQQGFIINNVKNLKIYNIEVSNVVGPTLLVNGIEKRI